MTPAGWRRGQRFTAAPGAERGSYAARVIPEEAGELLITIDAEWHDARATPPPVPLDPSEPARGPVACAAQRGRSLFVAKGCADPERNRIRTNEWVVMPDLDLAEAEIAVLVEYVNGGGIASVK